MAFSKLNTFVSDESGAVTVDWVVLTAAIVGLGLAVMSVVSGGVEDLSGDISNALTETNPLDDPFANDNQQAADGI
jgi:Flp pilus assembly pilin Flp